MNKTLIVPPSIEPVSLAEAKLHLRVDHGDDDTLISNLIISCRQLVESHLNMALIEQTWLWAFDRWEDVAKFKTSANNVVLPFTTGGGRYVSVPRGVISAVVSINTYDENDTATPWDIPNVIIDQGDGRICLRYGTVWPKPSRSSLGVEIIYKAGFGASADDVPAPIRHAVLNMVAYYYDLRGNGLNCPITVITNPALTMLAPFKMRRL